MRVTRDRSRQPFSPLSQPLLGIVQAMSSHTNLSLSPRSSELQAHQDENSETKRPFPVNSLPMELLAQVLVFWSYLDDDAPWMASIVCHHWRNVALTTNRVWGKITLKLAPEEEIETAWADEETLAQLTSPRGKRRPHALWFQRAHDAELSLHIIALSSYPRLNLELYDIVTGLQKQAEDIRRLTLSVESNHLADFALSILFEAPNPNRKLDHLEIEVSEKRVPKEFRIPRFHEDAVLDQFWVYSPPAKVLVFRGGLPRQRSSGVSGQTHTLILENVPVSARRFISDMAGFPSLRSLTLDGVTELNLISGLPHQSVNLRHLTNLSICVDTSYCSTVLKCLTAPRLESLSIRNCGLQELRLLWGPQENNTWFDCMAPFGEALEAFVRGSTTLRSLKLDRCPIDDQHLLRVLQAAPELQNLSMIFLLIGFPTMRGLLPPISRNCGAGEVPCPQLQHLTIENCSSIKKNDLLNLLKARCARRSDCAPITELTTFGCKDLVDLESELITHVGPRRPHVIVL
ncbi:hypothetical protein BDY19DRAFT_17523 [Irpex rosettiformis]|uniref:Uncharacterized protein n=1 Tax=Irpex rosettiformis TaxID=378272 RepID=A0ACB8UJP9_9APHY|nr:hypothetical protein BDY19DRAFT_17523 [Irpex rosettiformis]